MTSEGLFAWLRGAGRLTGFAFLLVLAHACGSSDAPRDRLTVAASTEVIADIVRNVAGDRAEVWPVVPPDGDIHTYSAAPSDIRRLAKSDLLVTVGANLEQFEEAAAWRRVAREVGVAKLEFGAELELIKVDRVIDHGDHVHDLRKGDPRIWLDPAMVISMTALVAEHLTAIAPAGGPIYYANAAAYRLELLSLHAEIEAALARLPAERKRILVQHDAFAYFAARYGIEVAGYITKTDSTEPSARDIADLHRLLDDQDIRAIFREPNRRSRLIESIAVQRGVETAELLSDNFGGRVGSYLEMMRFNLASLLSRM